MNYVILNGVKSTLIKGLIIQSLPSISKPRMRTEIEEIDGKDGDIVTKLGYSAYDRNMSIGLYGDYNIDDVIAYFNSEGIVTFSNELDKYYKYQIVEQIDFERLLRFRTATVTFHCQPFKYSAVENDFTFDNECLTVGDYNSVKGGVRAIVKNGELSFSGTPLVATEFYIPIKSQTLKAGSYSLQAVTEGTGATACSVRLITTVPDNAHSFAGNYLTFKNNDIASLNGSIAKDTTYGYLWFYITPNTALDFKLSISLIDLSFNNVSIRNVGNIYSKPKLTLYGNGNVNLSINGVMLFVLDIDGYITLDANEMNAYRGDVLVNRYVTGDYDKLKFNVGTNVVSWAGDVTKIEIQNFTRWI